MKQLINILDNLSEFNGLLSSLESGKCPVAVSGLSGVHRAHFASGIHEKTGRPVVLVCSDEDEAGRIRSDIAALTGEVPSVLPAREYTFHNAATVSRQWEQERIRTFYELQQEKVNYLIITAEAMLQRTMPPEVLELGSRTLKVGMQVEIGTLTDMMVLCGYSRCEQVEGPGQFAVRGGILDVFSPHMENPVRAEFWGDEIDSIGYFEVGSQRRVENLEEFTILPCMEILPRLAPGGLAGLIEKVDGLIKQAVKMGDKGAAWLTTLTKDRDSLANNLIFPAIDRYMALIYPQFATALDYLPFDGAIVLCESSRVMDRIKNVIWQYEEDCKALAEQGIMTGKLLSYMGSKDMLSSYVADFASVYLDSFTLSSYPVPPKTIVTVTARVLPAFGNSLETAVADLEHCRNNGISAVILVGSTQQGENLHTMMEEQGVVTSMDFQLGALPQKGAAVIAVGGLSSGFEYGNVHISVMVQGQPNIPKKKKKAKKELTNRQKLKSYADLAPGDLIVHEQHGVGRYVGMEKMRVDGVEKDYVKVCYAGSDVLYVPATQLDMISKYIGAADDGEGKKLNKLGGTEWEKAKTRTKKAVQDLAKGLIELYAQRQRQPGYSFSPDSPWQKEFEDQFEYVETDDQLRCVDEIKRDMERPIPMDRLLCGDVGYGKTEVALRAIMKCVLDGKQAAILCPTTVLARQHYLTAMQRFSHFPVNIEMISRYRTAAQTTKILEKLKNGEIDLLIGTHKLFGKGVEFKDLGLLVVDEEQRFGVTHKEKLKEMSRQVDVLTLSATPIPRTLNMALSGIRDMSTLEEPPMDRQPVQTYVLEHNWGIVCDAMRKELERGGQVYYLHNKVETIARTASRLREMLPEDTEIAIAHGKMTQDELANVMQSMSDGEIDVLVCTTIIETGIDISNANTLIIEEADHMGLAQLHQLRGRVGRSNRRAYAYMTYRRGKVLTEVAAKRLSAIREYAEFGSGFKIAMRDLEIRGAGNILGPEQSGFLMSVGYDLYLKLLEEAVLTEQGVELPSRNECTADLTISANIPDKYVPNAEQRMDLYRRIAAIRTEEDADDVTDELVDRYGDPPRPVNNLISVAIMRATAMECGIVEITQKGDNVLLVLDKMDLAPISTVCGAREYKQRLFFSPAEKPYLTLRTRRGEDVLKLVEKLVKDYAVAVAAK